MCYSICTKYILEIIPMRKAFSGFWACCSFVLCGMLPITACTNPGHIIQPEARNITSIAVKEGTVPDEIFTGELDKAGIVLVVSYSDNTSEEVPVTTSLIPEAYHKYLDLPGEYTITILFGGKTTTLVINIVRGHYPVKFYAYVDKNEYELIDTQEVLQHDAATAPSVVEDFYYGDKHYTFANWDREFNDVTAALDVYAQYNSVDSFIVNFYAYLSTPEYTLISSQRINPGEDAEAPMEFYYNERYYNILYGGVYYEGIHYSFREWDTDFTNINASLDVYAQYNSIEYYTVRFFDGNNELLDTQFIDKGSDARPIGGIEHMMPGYVFVGWDRSYLNITESIDIYALYVKMEITNVTATNITIVDSRNMRVVPNGSYQFSLDVDTNHDLTELYRAGLLIITSSDGSVAGASLSNGKLVVRTYGAGTATIRVSIGDVYDEIEFTVDPLRLVGEIDENKDYYLGMRYNGLTTFMTGNKSTYYLAANSDFDLATTVRIKDEGVDSPYRYSINVKVGDETKTIGSVFQGGHYNIGYVGESVIDTGGPFDLALFKINYDLSLSTIINGDEMFLGHNYAREVFSYRSESEIREKAYLYEIGVIPEIESISIIGGDFTMALDSFAKLEVLVSPINAFRDYSLTISDREIVNFKYDSKDTIVALKHGQTTITVTDNKSGIESTITVTVDGYMNYGTLENPLTSSEAGSLIRTYYRIGSGTRLTPSPMYVRGVITRCNDLEDGSRKITLDYSLAVYNCTDGDIEGLPVGENALVGYEVIICGYGAYNSGNSSLGKDAPVQPYIVRVISTGQE